MAKKLMTKITCVACGLARAFDSSSPAAPVLSACESAEKQGWSFEIGFLSMLTGDHQPKCKDCTQANAPAKFGILCPEPADEVER